MAVESNTTELRTLPDVTLPNLDGEPTSVSALAQDRPCVVVFTCNHCPYVQSVESELGAIADAHPDVAWVAICSNDVETHPDDDVPGLRDQATRAGWHFNYLVDTSQDVARTFGAVCTPDFFVFDAAGNLTYRGAMDDALCCRAMKTAMEHWANTTAATIATTLMQRLALRASMPTATAA